MAGNFDLYFHHEIRHSISHSSHGCSPRLCGSPVKSGSPLLHYIHPDVDRFACCGCGSCCKAWWILVDGTARATIEQKLAEKPHPLHGTSMPLMTQSDCAFIKLFGDDCACAYLMGNNHCWLHANLGAETKPFICTHYPKRSTVTPLGVFTTLTASCHTAARILLDKTSSELDPPIRDTRGEIPEKPFRLRDGLDISNGQYLHLERAIMGILSSSGVPLAHRVSSAAALLKAMERFVGAGRNERTLRDEIELFTASAHAPYDAPGVSEHLNLMRHIIGQRTSNYEADPRFQKNAGRILSELALVFPFGSPEVRPPLSITFTRARGKWWDPRAKEIDAIMTRWFRLQIWGKYFSYPFGLSGGMRILGIVYALIRLHALAKAGKEMRVVDDKILLEAVSDVEREYSHSMLVNKLWREILKNPLISADWFIPLMMK